MTAKDDCQQPGYDWAGLVPLLIHPIKVGIIEALWSIDEPLSATDLKWVFGDQTDLSHVAYHLSMLAKAGIVVKVGERKSRKTIQKFFRLR